MLRRTLTLVGALAALSSLASGYYHYTYFSSRSAPFNPIWLQFDLTQLPNNTVQYFISDQGPGALMPGDSFQAIISEIQLAASQWNIPSSQLKVAFGGLGSSSTMQSAPGIDVVFDDNMPPGLLAQTIVSTYTNVGFIAGGNTSFLPILRSKVQLRHDLTAYQQASYYDSTYTTIVHEFGHALGLQHTLTSAVMSTSVTRATTKASPLAADDIAGVSLLYPTGGFLATTGSITGRVILGSSGANLASVVALSPTTGIAVSNLTNPDGTYHIDAVPPGQYLVYVHPLPPPISGEAQPAGIQLPMDSSQSPFPANTGFVTQFYPGTRDWTQASPVTVSAANTSGGINFTVQPSAGPVVYGMSTYGYQGNTPIGEPSLPANGSFALVFSAAGAATNGQLTPGLSVSVVGSGASIAPNYTQYYERYDNNDFILTGLYTGSVSSTTPMALAVSTPSDVYILPAAFYVVPSGPPSISNLSQSTDPNGNGLLTVYGSNLSASTQIVFDGAPAPILGVNNDGSLTVSAPPGTNGYHAMIEALNPDGQTSGQGIGTAIPPQYIYPMQNPSTIAVVNSTLLPGTDAMVQINGYNTNFTPGQVAVGFGSSDILVKHVWVVNSGMVLVNVSVNGAAPPAVADVTVSDGLQTTSAPFAVQILAANPHQISLKAPVLSKTTGLPGLQAGDSALINTVGLPSNLTGWTLTISGQQTTFSISNGQITASVPGALPSGPAIVQLNSPAGDLIPPIVMQIDGPLPLITSAVNVAGSSVVHPGDTVTLTISNLFSGTSSGVTPLISVNVGGVLLSPIHVDNPFVSITLPSNIPTGATNIVITVDTRVSQPFPLTIQN